MLTLAVTKNKNRHGQRVSQKNLWRQGVAHDVRHADITRPPASSVATVLKTTSNLITSQILEECFCTCNPSSMLE